MSKTLRELRQARSLLLKHMVALKLTASEEEKLVSILEKEKITFTAFVHTILRQKLKEDNQ